MTKKEYLSQLGKYLKGLPKEDYASAIQYFKEYFSDSGEENVQQVIAELGTPKEAATELLKNLVNAKCISEDSETSKLMTNKRLFALTLCLAVPVRQPVLLLVMIAVFLVVAVLSILFLLVSAYALASIGSGLRYLYLGIITISSSLPAAGILSGAGLLEIGIAICISCFEVWLCKQLMHYLAGLLLKLCQKYIVNSKASYKQN